MRPVGAWGGAKTEGARSQPRVGPRWVLGRWRRVVTGESWSEGSTKTTGKSRRERGHIRRVGPWLRAEPRPDFRKKEGAWSHGRDSLREGPRPQERVEWAWLWLRVGPRQVLGRQGGVVTWERHKRQGSV